MGKDKVIGTKPCWVCGTELPRYQVPRGCELDCALSLREYPQSDGKMYYLCDIHGCILWDKEQRDLCLEELKVAQQN